MCLATPAAAQSYRSPALAALVADAAARNRYPRDLHAYRAEVETEITLIIRRADGTEAVGSVEQVASELRWRRTGVVDQRVQGHRMQQVGVNISMLTGFRVGWLNPTLYGNRLRTRQRLATDSAPPSDSAPSGTRRRQRIAPADTAPVVHPLADDRDAWYTYDGGDTLVVVQAGARAFPIVRVTVAPREGLTAAGSLFRGEMHIDASRGTLVRLRGVFEPVGAATQRSVGLVARVMSSVVQGVAFIDYENAERDERFWLPTTQRIELQAAAPGVTEGRAVFRIVSRFRDVQVNDTLLDTTLVAQADSQWRGARPRLSYAPDDSLRAFARWRTELGALSEGLHADDFDAVGPDRWRATGAPRLDVGVPVASDLLHINRVEGLFTGFGARLALRDASPGTVLRAVGGYAWSEGAVRGRVEMQRDRGPWRLLARAGRSLDITNDFRNPLDSGSALGPLTGFDEYDYVDRRFAGLQLQRTIGARELVWRVESGVAHDAGTPARLDKAPLGGTAFRLNRAVDEGGYWRNAITLAWRPDGSAEFLRPGWSGRLYAEQGVGELDFVRLEARLTARRQLGPFTSVSRADAGLLLGGSLPTQQLFELGRSQGLPGYEYKAFAGTQAVLARSLLLWTGPWWTAPTRLGNLVLPPFAPGASVGIQSGVTSAPGAAARAAVQRLGAVADSAGVLGPVSRASNGWRSSVSAGLRFFSGALFVGGAQALDRGERWRWLVTVGQQI